jgi:hypothetical protein
MITKRERLEAMAREWRQYADSHSGERAETFAHCSRVLLDALRGEPVPHTTLMADRPAATETKHQVYEADCARCVKDGYACGVFPAADQSAATETAADGALCHTCPWNSRAFHPDCAACVAETCDDQSLSPDSERAMAEIDAAVAERVALVAGTPATVLVVETDPQLDTVMREALSGSEPGQRDPNSRAR